MWHPNVYSFIACCTHMHQWNCHFVASCWYQAKILLCLNDLSVRFIKRTRVLERPDLICRNAIHSKGSKKEVERRQTWRESRAGRTRRMQAGWTDPIWLLKIAKFFSAIALGISEQAILIYFYFSIPLFQNLMQVQYLNPKPQGMQNGLTQDYKNGRDIKKLVCVRVSVCGSAIVLPDCYFCSI